MTELTQEYLDKNLKNLATKEDLKNLATKQDVETAVENLAIIVNKGFDNVQDQLEEISKRLDVREKIVIFEKKFEKLEQALNIKL